MGAPAFFSKRWNLDLHLVSPDFGGWSQMGMMTVAVSASNSFRKFGKVSDAKPTFITVNFLGYAKPRASASNSSTPSGNIFLACSTAEESYSTPTTSTPGCTNDLKAARRKPVPLPMSATALLAGATARAFWRCPTKKACTPALALCVHTFSGSYRSRLSNASLSNMSQMSNGLWTEAHLPCAAQNPFPQGPLNLWDRTLEPV